MKVDSHSSCFYFASAPFLIGHIMRHLIFPLMALLAVASFGKEFDPKSLRDGDIVFQSSKSIQSLGIRLATHSPVSHCGLVYSKDGKFYVLEASTTVRSIPFEKF